MRILAACDKFRGTASAREICAAIAGAARAAGHEAQELPLADGGEGTLEVLGGGNRSTLVTAANHHLVAAAWRLDEHGAVIEAARAAGLALVGGAGHNAPWSATTRGVGELLVAALDAGARSVVVGLGGTATTDGGRGAVDLLLERRVDLRTVDVAVAADVSSGFLDASRLFARQKGAGPALVRRLTHRLHREAERYRDEQGVDVTALPGAGAAGGLAGGLAALGARIVPGFDLVADRVGLDAALDAADLVVTGEGRLDRTTLEGKVVSGVLARAAGRTPALVVCGRRQRGVFPDVPVVCLSELYGSDASLAAAADCTRRALTARWSDPSSLLVPAGRPS